MFFFELKTANPLYIKELAVFSFKNMKILRGCFAVKQSKPLFYVLLRLLRTNQTYSINFFNTSTLNRNYTHTPTKPTVSNHFFIEITEQNKAYVLKAGQFESQNKAYFTKNYLANTEAEWAQFWLVFQNAYQANALDSKADVLLYIHGYFSGSTFQLNKILGKSNNYYTLNPNSSIALTLTVIWHTDYRLYNYTRRLCKNRAEVFAPSFWSAVLTLRDLLNERGLAGKTHLMCHSMGNYFLEKMLPVKPKADKPLFQEFVMAAADVRDDFYEKQHLTIGRLSHRTLAINNRKDFALAVSKWLNRQARLGKYPPQYLHNKYASIFATDVSEVRDVESVIGWFNQHLHHQASKKVILYLSRVFKGEKTVEVLF